MINVVRFNFVAKREDVFIAFGELALTCQNLEYLLVGFNVFIQSVVFWGKGQLETESTKSKLSKKWKSTLGRTASELHDTFDLPELKSILDEAALARNELLHEFFLPYSSDFESEEDCGKMLQRLDELK